MRREHDFYETPVQLTRVIAPHLHGRILDPCAGDLAIVNELHKTDGVDLVLAGDIDHDRPCLYTYDATDPAAPYWKMPFEWIVTNPPFSQAHRILPLAYECATVGVAFLLRLSYLEPTQHRNKRAEWLAAHAGHMTNLIVFGSPRPDFTGSGGDRVTTAWMVWRKGVTYDPPVFEFVSGWK